MVPRQPLDPQKIAVLEPQEGFEVRLIEHRARELSGRNRTPASPVRTGDDQVHGLDALVLVRDQIFDHHRLVLAQVGGFDGEPAGRARETIRPRTDQRDHVDVALVADPLEEVVLDGPRPVIDDGRIATLQGAPDELPILRGGMTLRRGEQLLPLDGGEG